MLGLAAEHQAFITKQLHDCQKMFTVTVQVVMANK